MSSGSDYVGDKAWLGALFPCDLEVSKFLANGGRCTYSSVHNRSLSRIVLWTSWNSWVRLFYQWFLNCFPDQSIHNSLHNSYSNWLKTTWSGHRKFFMFSSYSIAPIPKFTNPGKIFKQFFNIPCAGPLGLMGREPAR